MSQDHALGVLMGLRFVQKFINNESLYIKPTESDSGMWVMAETRLIAERIMEHLSENTIEDKTLVFPNRIKQEDGTTATDGFTEIEINEATYIIMNPVTGLPVDRGWEAFGMSGGYKKAGELLTNNEYSAAVMDIKSIKQLADTTSSDSGPWLINWIGNRIYDLTLDEATHSPQFWENLWQAMPKLALILDSITIPGQDTLELSFLDTTFKIAISDLDPSLENWPIGKKIPNNLFNNVSIQMILRLGAISNSWNQSIYNILAIHYKMPWYDILYSTLNDHSPGLSKGYYDSLLANASCKGISKWQIQLEIDTTFDSMGQVIAIDTTEFFPHSPFNRSDVFSLPDRDFNSAAWVDGDFNGLDYMLIHNLVRIAFSNQLQSSQTSSHCPCSSTMAIFNGDTLSSGVLDTITSILRFDEYKSIGIRLTEFITHDINLYGNGQINVNGDLKICNAQIELLDTSSIRVLGSNPTRRKELRVGNGGTLELNQFTTLSIDTFSKIIVEPGGTLIYHPNSKIIIDEGASLEILGNLIIKDSATFTVDPGPNGLGYVRFSNRGNTSLVSQAKIISGTNSKLDLSGTYKGHYIMQVDGDSAVVFPEELSVSIDTGRIAMGKNGMLEVRGPVVFTDLIISAMDTNNWFKCGIATIGQDSVVLKNIDFEYGNCGLMAVNYINGNAPTLYDIKANNMNSVVDIMGVGVNLDIMDFKDCSYGLSFYKISKPIEVKQARMENMGLGYFYDAQSQGSLGITSTTLINNGLGIYGQNGLISLRCSNLDANYYDVYLQNNPMLSINENMKAGGNLFHNNWEYTVYGENGAFQFDLSNGNSGFINNEYLFKGYFPKNTSLVKDSNNYRLTSSKNYWDPYPPTDYDLRYVVGNMGKINAATVNLYHLNEYINYDSFYAKRVGLCPSSGSCNPCLSNKDAGDHDIDNDNQMISNIFYTNASMGDVFEDINDKEYYQYDHDAVLERGSSILSYSMSNISKFDQYVLNRIYRSTLEAYGHIFYNPNTTDISGKTSELLGVMYQLEQQASNPVDTFWTAQYCQIIMDLADIYRMNDNRDSALGILSSRLINILDMDAIENVNSFTCVINMEKAVINGDISLSKLMDTFSCYPPPDTTQLMQDKNLSVNNQKDKYPLKEQILLFPNPAQTILNVDSRLPIENISIYNMMGQRVLEQRISGNRSIVIEISDLREGVYLAKVECRGLESTKKFIIKR